MTAALLYSDNRVEVWHGDALDPEDVAFVMKTRIADLLLVDAPYSERTHSGHAKGKRTADRVRGFGDSPAAEGNSGAVRRYAARTAKGFGKVRDIEYPAWRQEDVDAFVQEWHPRCSGWMVSITDHELAQGWESGFSERGLLTFPPLPLVETGSRIRMMGDGPSNWTCWIVVARPRNHKYSKWGTLPGAYIQPAERDINSRGGSDRIVGGKPEGSMRALVRDYSQPGDLVVDPCCGGGTTLMAAKYEGRQAIGIEKDLGRAELAARRASAVKENLKIAGYE